MTTPVTPPEPKPIARTEVIDAETFSADQLAAAEHLFTQTCTFVKGVVDVKGLPATGRPEVAFAGRSNVGKSSLLNALVNQKALARTSSTPGRTQEINYFDLAGSIYLVDLPGYGFAKAPKVKVDAWNRLIRSYLRGRVSLRRVFLLIDARHGLKPVDEEIAKMLDSSAVSFQGVLTKADKLGPVQLGKIIEGVTAGLARHPAAFPRLAITSSEKRTGLAELRAEVLEAAGG